MDTSCHLSFGASINDVAFDGEGGRFKIIIFETNSRAKSGVTRGGVGSKSAKNKATIFKHDYCYKMSLMTLTSGQMHEVAAHLVLSRMVPLTYLFKYFQLLLIGIYYTISIY